jgi:hypothetical protein
VSRTTSKIIGITLLAFTLGGGTAVAQSTMAQQDACRPDVFRLCSRYIPEVGQIVTCLRGNEARRAAFSRGTQYRHGRALAHIGSSQHAGTSAFNHPAVPGTGDHGRYRRSRCHARLHAAAMRGRRQGHHDVGARRWPWLCRPRQRECGGRLDDESLRGAARAQRLRKSGSGLGAIGAT